MLLLGTSGSNSTPQASNTVNVASVDNIQQHPQMEPEVATPNFSGLSAIGTHDVPSSISAENLALENESSEGVDAQSHKPSASGRSEPLGLGGGLIPKVLLDLKCFSLLNSISQVLLVS